MTVRAGNLTPPYTQPLITPEFSSQYVERPWLRPASITGRGNWQRWGWPCTWGGRKSSDSMHCTLQPLSYNGIKVVVSAQGKKKSFISLNSLYMTRLLKITHKEKENGILKLIANFIQSYDFFSFSWLRMRISQLIIQLIFTSPLQNASL